MPGTETQSPVIYYDLDDTLVKARFSWPLGRAAMLHIVQRDLQQIGIDFRGKPDTQIFAEWLALEGIQALPKVRQAVEFYEASLLASTGRSEIIPGAQETLQALHDAGADQRLLTGNTHNAALAKLRGTPLLRFFIEERQEQLRGAFCRSDDVEERIQIAKRARDAAPDAMCIVIGDTPHDVAVGKEIGAITVAVTTGSHSREILEYCKPDYLLSSLTPHSMLDICRQAPQSAQRKFAAATLS